MKLRPLTPGTIVLGVFVASGLVYACAAYLFSQFPSPEERCKQHCSEIDRMARLVPVYPNARNARSGDGPLRCECY